VLLVIRVILSTTLYAMRRSDLMMIAMLASGFLSLLASVPLAARFGLIGPVLGRAAAELLLLLAVVMLTRRATRRSGTPVVVGA
jgi:O-antigen/teichoic acid export membrane protein